jgi:hypothetical protein
MLAGNIGWPQKIRSWYYCMQKNLLTASSDMATVMKIFGLETLFSFQCIIYYMDVIPQHSLGGRGKYGGA